MPGAPFLLNERVNVPWGIACLSAFLKAHGRQVSVVHPQGESLDALSPLLECDAIGASVTTPLYNMAVVSMRWLREHGSKARFIVGGPHASGARAECLADGWNTVVIGEGEVALEQVLEWEIGGVHKAERRIADLGSLPIPDFEGVQVWNYHWDVHGIIGGDLHTARGCVHDCAFCNNACSWGQTLHGYPVWYIKLLIERLARDYGFRGFMVQDDSFVTRHEVFRQITDYFDATGLVYRCQLRADQMTEDVAIRLRNTGCIGVGIGIESMVQLELDTMLKGTTVEANRRCLELCNEYGLSVTAYLMLGVPHQTYESAMQTFKEMCRYKPERVHPGMLCLYPGTAFYSDRAVCGLHFRDDNEDAWVGTHYKGNPFETHSPVYTDWMTAEEIEAVKDAYWREWSTGFYGHDKQCCS